MLFPTFTSVKAKPEGIKRGLNLKVQRTFRLSASFCCIFPFTQFHFPVFARIPFPTKLWPVYKALASRKAYI
jgi:hypothetical protein